MCLKRAIYFVYALKGFLQVEPEAHCLHSQMIFLVDHDADPLGRINDHSATRAFGSVFPADQMPFD